MQELIKSVQKSCLLMELWPEFLAGKPEICLVIRNRPILRTEESLEDFVYDGFCGANLSKYMIEASKLEGKTHGLS